MMRNQLQYVYSIFVFAGVLMTAYLMLNSDGNARFPLRALQEPSFRMEASVEPAVQQLLQMEHELGKLKKKYKEEEKDRTVSQDPSH